MKIPPHTGVLEGPARDDLQLRQTRRLSKVIVGAALDQIHGGLALVVIGHYDDRHPRGIHIVDKGAMLVGRTGIEIQNHDVAAVIPDLFLELFRIRLQGDFKLTSQSGPEQQRQFLVL